MQFQKWWMRPCPFLWGLSAPREGSCLGLHEVCVPGGSTQSPGSVHVLPIPRRVAVLHSGGHTVPGQQQELPWPWASSQHHQQLSLEGPSQPPPRGAPPLGQTDGQTDRWTALCENGFESPGLCHFKLACNGFPWEVFCPQYHPGHCKKPQALLLLQPSSV